MSGFTIPNTPDATNQNQAEPDSLDFQILGKQVNGVVSGMTVTPGSGQAVSVASGEVLINGSYYSYTSASVGLTNWASSNFFDVIIARVLNGVITCYAIPGTSGSNPRFPATGATGTTSVISHTTDVVLATVWRTSGNTPTSGEITDKRVFVRSNTNRVGSVAPSGSHADLWVQPTTWSPTATLEGPISVRINNQWIRLARWPDNNNFTAGTITATSFVGPLTGNASTTTLATKSSTLSQGGGNGTAMTFNWSGQSGQPTWLWGSNDGVNHYVYNPGNFSVNYATTSAQTRKIFNDSGTILESVSGIFPTWYQSSTPGVDNAYYFGGQFVGGFGYFNVPAWSVVASYSFQSPSDRRLKDDIEESVLGLTFINSLNPVSYKMKVGRREVQPDGTVTEIPGVRTHYGFIAQEVGELVQSSGGDDFAGWIMSNPNDDESAQSLNYLEFISPIVKAIQELSNRIDELEGQ